MKVSQLTDYLAGRDQFRILLLDGTPVPTHFHVTEVGEVTKRFIDCGGTQRTERRANLQLWNANDYDHRLHPGRLIDILELSRKTLGMGDLDIEVEYQGAETIAKFDLEVAGDDLVLTARQTACLAPDACGVPAEKTFVSLAGAVAKPGNCAPGSGCC